MDSGERENSKTSFDPLIRATLLLVIYFGGGMGGERGRMLHSIAQHSPSPTFSCPHHSVYAPVPSTGNLFSWSHLTPTPNLAGRSGDIFLCKQPFSPQMPRYQLGSNSEVLVKVPVFTHGCKQGRQLDLVIWRTFPIVMVLFPVLLSEEAGCRSSTGEKVMGYAHLCRYLGTLAMLNPSATRGSDVMGREADSTSYLIPQAFLRQIHDESHLPNKMLCFYSVASCLHFSEEA
ncbi:uncharacterized protein LOC107320009 [Coturnix japonica]|uniref:uncharacterized protein LOC107320009 n=1 Tax=Coturnix japonica TaxID=93934 RepID=UPI0013A5E402|nr:uncharacterized protein LOC107320009 [Coturnix japonica]